MDRSEGLADHVSSPTCPRTPPVSLAQWRSDIGCASAAPHERSDKGSTPVKKTYPAILFRQRKASPLQVAFAAASSEIDSWARVPTKRTANIRNFQRAELAKHSVEITSFFNNEENSSPTAVVVGFDPIRSANRVVTRDAAGVVIGGTTIATGPTGEGGDGVVAGTPVMGTIEIEWGDPEDASTAAEQIERIAAVARDIRHFIYAELSDITGLDTQKAAAVEEYLAAKMKAGYEPTASEDSDVEDEGGTGETADAAHSLEESPLSEAPEEVKTSLAGLSPSEQQVVVGRLSFLAATRREFLEARPSSIPEIYRMVLDELKPGILIDGQHRVMGTKKLGNIPFLVTALPAANWSELAFQFIVTNRTARRVPESLLISIIGNSLSKAQRGQIEERLREAGIRVGLIEAVMRVHEDEQSPFFGLLSFGLKNESGFLDAAAMRGKVILPWYERQGAIQYLFDHFCEGKRKIDRTEYWKSEELWFEYLVAFWSAVKTRYLGSNVFSPELADPAKKLPYSKLMTATVLMIFQDTVLRHLQELYTSLESAQNTPVSTHIAGETQFSEIVRNTLQKLTPDFFTGWQLSGFDGSRGAREDLQEAITLVIGGKKSVAQLKDVKKPHRLFKEQPK